MVLRLLSSTTLPMGHPDSFFFMHSSQFAVWENVWLGASSSTESLYGYRAGPQLLRTINHGHQLSSISSTSLLQGGFVTRNDFPLKFQRSVHFSQAGVLFKQSLSSFSLCALLSLWHLEQTLLYLESISLCCMMIRCSLFFIESIHKMYCLFSDLGQWR